MPGWIFRVEVARPGNAETGDTLTRTYMANMEEEVVAWAAVASLINRTDPLAKAETLSRATDEQLAAHGVAYGQLKLIEVAP